MIETLKRNVLAELVAERGHLVIDGGTGTELFARGLKPGDAPERMNLDQPEAVLGLHRSYLEVGADIVLTNTFGANRHRLRLHGLDARVAEINARAAAHARSAADGSGRRVLVAGSIGPTGELLAPLGTLSAEQAAESFAEQARGLAEGGADLAWVETMSALEEVETAVCGIGSVTDLPVVVTMSFDTAGRTMMGVTGSDAGSRLVELGAAGIGANCGNNLADTEAALAEIRAAAGGVPVVAKANAGIPRWEGSELVYDGTPEAMAAHAHRVRSAGVAVIGGCCGNTPAHIAAIRAVLDGAVEPPDIEAAAPERATPGERQPAGGGRRRSGRRRSR